jgi:replicative DNA helicase
MSNDFSDRPHDTWTERAVIGGVLAAGTIPDGVTLPTFYDPHLEQVARAATALAAKGEPTDPVSVRAALLRSGVRGPSVDGVWLFDVMQAGCLVAQISHHVGTLRELATRREVIAAAGRAWQAALNPSSDPFDVAADLWVTAAAIAETGDPVRPSPLVDGADFVAGETSYDFLIPGLLERGDRLLVTGGEGSGKSVLTRQLAICAAAGMHPFAGDRHDPVRVTLVDLENGTRHLRRALLALWEHATLIGRPIARGFLTVESRPSGIDLTGPEDRLWLQRLCDASRPDLLVIGPLYRMHAADMNAEEPARLLTRTIDGLRAQHGCAVVMETHSPHGLTGHTRSLRPIGSSLFMRWPEFGYGLRPDGEDGVMKLGSWRGPRDERDFPHQLVRGGPQEWPWSPKRFEVAAGWAS